MKMKERVRIAVSFEKSIRCYLVLETHSLELSGYIGLGLGRATLLKLFPSSLAAPTFLELSGPGPER